eukprot:CAMPEP_0173097420 /NCGR_PEP_ID=MMETSP1102-20130122/33874_1 /TAXON_ID=49646 /ORGANISM="Geminigera sp., Strain Caron Lab Isolate" /LENGTH=82 /DNA_ID=CAMNT_0013989221 /DNA_START=261 /DNA_END=509 /DNA_ORIENTATION=-
MTNKGVAQKAVAQLRRMDQVPSWGTPLSGFRKARVFLCRGVDEVASLAHDSIQDYSPDDTPVHVYSTRVHSIKAVNVNSLSR